RESRGLGRSSDYRRFQVLDWLAGASSLVAGASPEASSDSALGSSGSTEMEFSTSAALLWRLAAAFKSLVLVRGGFFSFTLLTAISMGRSSGMKRIRRQLGQTTSS